MSAPEMWPAQREAVSFCLQRPATMLDMGMGCGKTRVAIEVIRRREGVRRVLVVCPKAVVPVRGRECAKYLETGAYQVHERSARAWRCPLCDETVYAPADERGPRCWECGSELEEEDQ